MQKQENADIDNNLLIQTPLPPSMRQCCALYHPALKPRPLVAAAADG